LNTAMICPLNAQNNEAGDAAKPEPFVSGISTISDRQRGP
jgi:hypothetical protein